MIECRNSKLKFHFQFIQSIQFIQFIQLFSHYIASDSTVTVPPSSKISK